MQAQVYAYYVYTLDAFWLADDEGRKTSRLEDAMALMSAAEANEHGTRHYGTGEYFVLAWVKY